MNPNKNSFIPPAVILGIGLVLAVAVNAGTNYKIRSLEDTLSVTGSAKKQIGADTKKSW